MKKEILGLPGLFFSLLILLASTHTCLGQIERAFLTGSQGVDFDGFGFSTAISSAYALIAAPGADNKDTDAGAVYAFKRNGTAWVEETILTASNGKQSDFFGFAVALTGDYAFVGAPDAHAVYVFRRNKDTWTEETILKPGNDSSSAFGVAIDTFGDYVVIGAPEQDQGAVYVFKLIDSMWILEATLTASTGGPSNVFDFDSFGLSVAISGNYVLVGASQQDTQHINAGVTYVFKRHGNQVISQWTEEAPLMASNGEAYDEFGHSIAIAGDHAFIGAPGKDNGAIYVFKFNGTAWLEEAVLTAPPEDDIGGFGSAIALSTSYAIIGAYTENAIYVFEPDGNSWKSTSMLSFADSRWIGFGEFVSLSGDYFLVGLDRDDTQGNNAGAAYAYELESNATSKAYHLDQNYPNPFSPTTTISYTLPVAGHVQLRVFDLLGREIALLVDETKAPGTYAVPFNAPFLANGAYLYQLRTPDRHITRVMTLMR